MVHFSAASMLRAMCVVCVLGVSGVCGGVGWAATPEQQQRWLDARLPADERAVLDTIVGFSAPEFPDEARWIEGDAVTLESLHGKVVVLQSWTRASANGRAAPRRVQQLLSRFSEDDVAIVAIHTPEGEQGLEQFVERVPVGVRSVVDPVGAWCDELGIFRRPVTILIDRSGEIRFAGVSYAGLADAVGFLVKEEAREKKVAALPARDERTSAPVHPTQGPTVRETSFPRDTGNPRGANDLRGQKGPKIEIGQWVSNAPRSLADKVVVVEFWATWCGPCIAGIPHLNELQKAMGSRGVIVGISDEDLSTVQNFVRQREMNYAIACDPERKMRNVVGNRGIPHCIVMCPEGIVRWQGHPAALSRETLLQIADASGIGAADGGGEEESGGGGGQITGKRWVEPKRGS